MVKLIDRTYVAFDFLFKSTSHCVIEAELELVRKVLCLQKKWKQHPPQLSLISPQHRSAV